LNQSVISFVVLISFLCYCGDYAGYITVILPFLAFYFCSTYFLYLVYYIADVNPFQYVLTRRIIGGKYNKWIAILQEFDLDFASTKSKKSQVFAELITDFPRLYEDVIHVDSFIDEHTFLVSSSDPWYGDIVLYLQTLKFAQHLSRDDRRCVRYQAKKYTIVGDTLYHQGIDSILRHFLTHEEAELVLNDFHKGAYGGHLFGLATAQKIL
jgi:hypothetical protein